MYLCVVSKAASLYFSLNISYNGRKASIYAYIINEIHKNKINIYKITSDTVYQITFTCEKYCENDFNIYQNKDLP